MPFCPPLFLTALAIVQHPNNWVDNESENNALESWRELQSETTRFDESILHLSFAPSQTEIEKAFRDDIPFPPRSQGPCMFPFPSIFRDTDSLSYSGLEFGFRIRYQLRVAALLAKAHHLYAFADVHPWLDN